MTIQVVSIHTAKWLKKKQITYIYNSLKANIDFYGDQTKYFSKAGIRNILIYTIIIISKFSNIENTGSLEIKTIYS